MPDQRYRVLFVASHAVQYQSPIFRRLAMQPELDIHVAYCTLKGAEAAHDAEFGAKIQWDIPLLDGYPWSEVPNRGSGKESFFGLCNPGLWSLIRAGSYDAVVCYVGYVRASFWVACLAAKLTNAAFLFGTDAASLAARDGRSWKVPVKKLFWPWLYGLAHQVMVPSSRTRDLMLSLGLPGDSVTLTPYCVENDWWIEESKKVSRAAIRESWREVIRVLRSVQRAAVGIALGIILLLFLFPEALLSRVAFYTETLSPSSSASQLQERTWDYPLRNFLGAFGYERWPYGYGIGTSSLGTQYVAKFFHVKPPGAGVESGFGTLVVEMGIGGLLLWLLMSLAILLSAWRVVKKLRGSPWFPIAFMIFWYAGLLLLPMTFAGIQAYEDFVLNAFLWLSLGILFRLPSISLSAEFAALQQNVQLQRPWMR